MFFEKSGPTVTPEDKDWVEEAFLWFESEYSPEYLRKVRFIEPTKAFFPLNFKGTEENANQITQIICDYMEIKEVDIKLHFFSASSIELATGIVTTQSGDHKMEHKGALGTYFERGLRKYSIGLERELLKDPVPLIATLAHELSHLVLLGENRLDNNDEHLTDLNTIALGFGIFTANSIFRFQQWQGSTHQGWQANRSGYIPEQVAAYGLALLSNYQNTDDSWSQFLNKSVKKMYDKNIAYLKSSPGLVKFK